MPSIKVSLSFLEVELVFFASSTIEAQVLHCYGSVGQTFHFTPAVGQSLMLCITGQRYSWKSTNRLLKLHLISGLCVCDQTLSQKHLCANGTLLCSQINLYYTNMLFMSVHVSWKRHITYCILHAGCTSRGLLCSCVYIRDDPLLSVCTFMHYSAIYFGFCLFYVGALVVNSF